MKFIYIALLLILSFNISGEIKYIDSLKNELFNKTDKESSFDITLEIATYMASENPDSALLFLIEVEKIALKIQNQNKLVKYYYLIAECYFYLNDYQSAIPFYQKSNRIAQKIDDKLQVSETFHCMGLCYFYTGYYEKALYNNHEALLIAEELEIDQRIANSYQNIGLVYSEIKSYSKAQEYYEQAIEINEKINNNEKIAALYQNIGVIHHNKKHYDEAIKFYNKSLEIYEKLKDKLGIASSYYNIGLIYEYLNDNRAIDNYQHAKIIFEEINYVRGIIYTLNSLSNYSKIKGFYNEAINYLKQSIALAKKYHITETLVESYKEASDIYSLVNKHKESLVFYKKYTHLNDSLYNANNVRQILELEMKYQSEKFENKLQKEKFKNRIYIGGFVIVLILFILYLIVFIIRKRL